MTGDDEHLIVFEHERPRLVGLAYRLLGSLADAEDAVQDAWLRWSRTDVTLVENPAAWLTTTVSRLGLDRLRARRRAQETYLGPWLPEPLVRPVALDDPAEHAEMADSLTTAFLVLLERLSPEERLVLLLADVFGEPFPTVAEVVGRSPDATRQLAVRARRKLTGGYNGVQGATDPTRSLGEASTRRTSQRAQLAIATSFVGAVMSGDIEAVRAMLQPDAVLTSDGGPHRHAARRPVVGADRVARFLVNLAKRLPLERVRAEVVWVNGSPGMVVLVDDVVSVVQVIEVSGDLVSHQYTIVNPDKLGSIGRSIELV